MTVNWGCRAISFDIIQMGFMTSLRKALLAMTLKWAIGLTREYFEIGLTVSFAIV